MNRLISISIAAAFVALGSGLTGDALARSSDKAPSAYRAIDCDRKCLEGAVDAYLAALVARKPEQAPWAKHVKFTENNVEMKIGDGLWGTITGQGDYKLYFADPDAGQVGFFGTILEQGVPAILAVRLKVVERRIAEVETIVSRRLDNGIFPRPELLRDKPILSEVVPEERRRPRARLISIADGYFDTLQLNDGTLFTQFDKDCARVENGIQSTNNPEFAPPDPVPHYGCEEQFKLGNFRYDDRLRARRYPLVDEERGLVLAAAFIDHSGRLQHYTLTDGTPRESRYKSPHSYVMLEIFKIVDGKIRLIEAVFVTVPYNMPSPWKR